MHSSSAFRIVVERTPLTSRLAESRDPESLRQAADEAEAASRWGSRRVAELVAAGNDVEARAERRKNEKSRARARLLRKMADRLEARLVVTQ